MSSSNLKGWIGFLVITILIIGGVMTAHQILPSKAGGATISGISSSDTSGYYISANQTFVANISDSSTSATFVISISSPVASAGMNISVVAPAIENMSAYNATYTTLYNQIYNSTVNATIASGTTLNSSINASIAQNASRLAATYTNQNLTYNLFPSVFENITSYSGGVYKYNLTVNFNATAVGLMSKGQSLHAIFNAATGPISVNGFITFRKN